MNELAKAVMTSIEALQQVPGTQLQHIEMTLRHLYADLKNAGIGIPAELDDLIEEAAIAKAEERAYMNGVGDEDIWDLYHNEMLDYLESYIDGIE